MIERGLLGETLIELRESARLSQRDLAQLSGISHGTIRDIELGKGHHRRVETLQQIAAGLATEADGVVNQQRSEGYLQQLLAAAGKSLMVIGPEAESAVTERPSLADELKTIRYERRASPTFIEKRSGVKRATIYNLENGRTDNPDPTTLSRIARAVSTDLADEQRVYSRLMQAAGYGGADMEAVPNLPDPPPDMTPHDVQEIHITIVRSEDGGETITVDVRGYDPTVCGEAARQAICAARRPPRPSSGDGSEGHEAEKGESG